MRSCICHGEDLAQAHRWTFKLPHANNKTKWFITGQETTWLRRWQRIHYRFSDVNRTSHLSNVARGFPLVPSTFHESSHSTSSDCHSNHSWLDTFTGGGPKLRRCCWIKHRWKCIWPLSLAGKKWCLCHCLGRHCNGSILHACHFS